MSTESKVGIRFFTKQNQYAVPDFPFEVHITITPDELNVLVNEHLKDTIKDGKRIEFDFLVCSEFLRTSLYEHVTERDVSTEGVIDIEYLEKHPSPKPKDCLIHDDWVAAVAVCGKWILTGCYDNTVHIWTSIGKHKLTIPGHSGPVIAVKWISLDSETGTFVSASQDGTALIWSWNIARNSVDCIYVCRGHRESLESLESLGSLAVNSDDRIMATGSWDKMLKIWSTATEDETEDGESKSKRMKTDKGKTRIPKRTMKGHQEAISGVVWSDKSELITSSWDHTLKIWDSELGGIKHEIPGNKSFFDIDYSQLSRSIIAASDITIKLYDPRSSEGSIVKSTFKSHKGTVSTVCWSPTDSNLFISGGYDNAVKLWDTRR
ncbi:hypothetical protein PV327_000332 [Microctonus hyperodae]|nr:hypothetical protein PV327_000332 [Microctonus hyperodae]